MKRINNCKFKETFPWIWDRFNKITLVKSNEYASEIKIDELYSISINRHFFQIKDIRNQKVFGTITTETLLSLNSKSEVVNNFLKSLLSKEVMTNREKFDHICGFAGCAGLEDLKCSIKDEIKDLFYPGFKIQMSGDSLSMHIISDIGVLDILLSHSGLVLHYNFETDNYVVDWDAGDGCAKLKQFYQKLNSVVFLEITSNKEQ